MNQKGQQRPFADFFKEKSIYGRAEGRSSAGNLSEDHSAFTRCMQKAGIKKIQH